MPARTPIDLRLAVLTPERPHNLGAMMRLAACLDLALDVVEPAAFPLDDRRIREAALDYWQALRWRRHLDLAAFLARCRDEGRRVVLLSTQGAVAHHAARYRGDDVLTVGSEHAGAPRAAHDGAGLIVRIPLRPGVRSLNVAVAAGMVAGEALRQLDGFDHMKALPADGSADLGTGVRQDG